MTTPAMQAFLANKQAEAEAAKAKAAQSILPVQSMQPTIVPDNVNTLKNVAAQQMEAIPALPMIDYGIKNTYDRTVHTPDMVRRSLPPNLPGSVAKKWGLAADQGGYSDSNISQQVQNIFGQFDTVADSTLTDKEAVTNFNEGQIKREAFLKAQAEERARILAEKAKRIDNSGSWRNR